MSNTSPATVTITSTTGPGISSTAAVFSDVTNIEYDFGKNTIKITHGNIISYYSYAATATVTQVITAGSTVITIS